MFFAKRYGHRAVVLETIAGVPGMVAGTLRHLRALRRMESDNGWIQTLLNEAENERMHLMTFVEIAEEAVFSYTEYLADIDSGLCENVAAPEIAIEYWDLRPDARLREVVLAVRDDEAHHRDVNHHFSDDLSRGVLHNC